MPKIKPIELVIYGIWSEDSQRWLINGTGVVFHTSYLQVAMAELYVTLNQLGLSGDWIVAKIGIDGMPDKEAMQVLANA